MSLNKRETLPAGRFETCPASDIFLQSNRDIAQPRSHDTNIVYYEFRVN